MTRDPELALIHSAVARLRAGVLAIVFGGVGAAGLFLATALLLLQGGENVGQHLSRLAWYLPGYSVSWGGALLGGGYGLLLGGALGWICAWTYNQVALSREGR
ncbi:MAG: hypothetical protein KDA24_16530 [Deltaproteobacteria bacterium]|nr:hypothetical protein [Deltaproteobacteria bacterium]